MSKSRFRLSRANYIFLTLVVIGYSVLHFLTSGNSDEEIGYFIGTIFMLGAMPLICAVLVWRTSKNDTQSVSLIFNIILGISVFVTIQGFGRNRSSQNKTVENLIENKEEYANQYKALRASDPDKLDSLATDYQNSVLENMSNLSENSSSAKEKKIYGIIQEFAMDKRELERSWAEAYKDVMAERILDYSQLKNEGELEFQVSTLKRYVVASEDFKNFMTNTVSLLKANFTPVGLDNKTAQGALKGALELQNKQGATIESLLSNHMGYGNGMIKIVTLLDEHQNKWKYMDQELQFSDVLIEENFYELLDNIQTNENNINQLSEQLINTL